MRRRHKLATVLLFSAAPLLPGCVTDAGTQQQQEHEADLVQLRDELLQTPVDTALAQVDHFRPLCDAEGYPLVGNVATKSIGLQPSAFCEEVRKLQ